MHHNAPEFLRKPSKGEQKFMMQKLDSAKLGKNLKKLIKENNYTQAKFANEVPADETTIRRWLKNGIDKLSIIERIAEIFNRDFEDILRELLK